MRIPTVAILCFACIAALAFERGMAQTAADAPQLPPPSELLSGTPQRASDGAIRLQEADRSRLRVCPRPEPGCDHSDLASAAAAAAPGTEIVLAPGVYEQGAVLAADGMVLRGEPGAHLKGHPIMGKAALVVTGDGILIEGIECSGIEVPDQNGACIRIEGDDLTVRNVNFHDNQQGILSGPGGGRVLVEASRFERNGRGGQAHGLYIGLKVEEFIFRGNRVLSTKDEGHGVKSRARRNVIEDNVIASLEGNDSRAIDLSNGGEAVIRRNLLQKGPNSANSQMIGIALEDPISPVNSSLIEKNLIIFDPPESELSKLLGAVIDVTPSRGTVVLSRSPGEIVLRGNAIVGAREIGAQLPEGANTLFNTRKAARLPPYPDVTYDLVAQAIDGR